LLSRLLIKAQANVNATKTNGSTPLFKAAQEGYVSCVRVLVDSHADLNRQFETGATALFTATMNRHSEVVRTLLESGADASITCHNDPPVPFATPLQIGQHVAATSCVQLLSGTPPPARSMPYGVQGEEIVTSLSANQLRFISQLLEQQMDSVMAPSYCGFDVNARIEPTEEWTKIGCVEAATPLLYAASKGVYYKSTTDHNDQLTQPTVRGNVEVTRHLLRLRADVERGTPSGYTPLMSACRNGHADVAELLLASGADANRVTTGGSQGKGGFALMFACMITKDQFSLGVNNDAATISAQVAQVLLAGGADVDKRDGAGYTPLLATAEWGHLPLAKVLLAHNASVHVQLDQLWPGYTPLIGAIQRMPPGPDQRSMVKLLVEANAEPSALCGPQPGSGSTQPPVVALAWALRKGALDSAAYLREMSEKRVRIHGLMSSRSAMALMAPYVTLTRRRGGTW